MTPGLEPAELPADAVEVGRIHDAWGIKGWFKIIPYSAWPEALFSCRRWYLLPAERGGKNPFDGPVCLPIAQVRTHGDAVVASARGVDERNAAEALKGARIFVPRASFPTLPEGEYYWVDLIGLHVVNREGVALGTVTGLMETGPQQVLVLADAPAEGSAKPRERLIPFVGAFVDDVDLPAKRITVDWQPDY